MKFLQKPDLSQKPRDPRAQQRGEKGTQLRHSARGWGWGQSSHISPVSGQQERTEAGGTRRTGDASLAQTSPDLSSCGRGREASLQLRRLQEEEGRKRQGGVTGGCPENQGDQERDKGDRKNQPEQDPHPLLCAEAGPKPALSHYQAGRPSEGAAEGTRDARKTEKPEAGGPRGEGSTERGRERAQRLQDTKGPGKAGDSGWDVGVEVKSWGRGRVGGCGAAAAHLS